MHLRREETFHSTTPLSESEASPVISIPRLPRRSPTCPRALEAVYLSEKRMASILGRLSLSPNDSNSNETGYTEEDLPVPRGILKAQFGRSIPTVDTNPDSAETNNHGPSSKIAKRAERRHSHGSDSGLGSSIGSCDSVSATERSEVNNGQVLDLLESKRAAINSARTSQPEGDQRRQFPLYACKTIERYIFRPILKEGQFQPFYPLVKSLPKRILDKEISYLRDVEQSLLRQGTSYSPSKASYIDFSHFMIQCIHTTVSHLNERDHHLPADRPYTNGYFIDLVAQVHRYAAMISDRRAQARTRRDSSESIEKADAPHTEHISLEGGLCKTGRPAELVVYKDGKAISLMTGQPYNENTIPSIKRALSDGLIDEDVERSMARRKKNEPPMNINQKCKHCDKVFKRPCDLSKHEKTHTRPWKCTELTCKYYEIGWPTEKERDRHINDKHSTTPTLYKCQFTPCPYQSKRESNCKQHMEKAHGWTYERSKNNGKPAGSNKGSSTQSSPQSSSVHTPISIAVDLPTPLTGFGSSLSDSPMNDSHFSFADPPLPTKSTELLLEDAQIPYLSLLNPSVPTKSNDFQLFSDDSGLEHSAMDGYFGLFPMSPGFQTFNPQLDADTSSNFNMDYDPLNDSDINGYLTGLQIQFLPSDPLMQQPELYPLSGVPPSMYDLTTLNASPGDVSNLSPAGEGDVMLYTPDSTDEDGDLSEMWQIGWGRE